MKILANDGISKSGKDALVAAGFTVVTDTVPQDQLAQAINDVGYIGVLVRSATTVRQDVIDQCPNLRFIGRGGVGMDNIDVTYAREKGIHVFNTPGSSSGSVAELVMAQLFDMVRSLYDSNRQMPTNGLADFAGLKKKYAKGAELRGKTLGIIGFGRIGREVATYALGCGMKVIAYDRLPSHTPVTLSIPGFGDLEVEVPQVEFNDLLSTADMITLHVPKQEGGRAILRAEELAKTKKGVYLVNTARGGSIDEDALLEGLNSGHIAAAALDVFENEPTPRQDILQHPRISLTPHVGAATLEAQDRIGKELADNIIALLGVQA